MTTTKNAPTLKEKVESLEETVAHFTQENEGVLAKVAEQDITINTLRFEKVEMVKMLRYEIKKAQERSRSRAGQAAQADSAGRAGTLSVDLSTCKLASAKRGKKQRVVADIEDDLQRRCVRSDKPVEDALKYYLLAPRKLALLKSLTIQTFQTGILFRRQASDITEMVCREGHVLKTGVWAEHTRVAESRSTTFLGLR